MYIYQDKILAMRASTRRFVFAAAYRHSFCFLRCRYTYICMYLGDDVVFILLQPPLCTRGLSPVCTERRCCCAVVGKKIHDLCVCIPSRAATFFPWAAAHSLMVLGINACCRSAAESAPVSARISGYTAALSRHLLFTAVRRRGIHGR